jgi:hypothetical protein
MLPAQPVKLPSNAKGKSSKYVWMGVAVGFVLVVGGAIVSAPQGAMNPGYA